MEMIGPNLTLPQSRQRLGQKLKRRRGTTIGLTALKNCEAPQRHGNGHPPLLPHLADQKESEGDRVEVRV